MLCAVVNRAYPRPLPWSCPRITKAGLRDYPNSQLSRHRLLSANHRPSSRPLHLLYCVPWSVKRYLGFDRRRDSAGWASWAIRLMRLLSVCPNHPRHPLRFCRHSPSQSPLHLARKLALPLLKPSRRRALFPALSRMLDLPQLRRQPVISELRTITKQSPTHLSVHPYLPALGASAAWEW